MTSCSEMVSKRRSLRKRSTLLRNVCWLCFCTSPDPQNSRGMILDKTAWQNDEMLEIWTANPVKEVWPLSGARIWVECRDFRRALGAFPESLFLRGTVLALLL